MASDFDFRQYIRDVPDFPKPGILFRDISPMLKSPEAMSVAIDTLAEPFLNAEIDVVAAPEARGFIFAVPLAIRLNAAFVPIRKPGKLPYETYSHSYDLEYGSDTLEMHIDAVQPGQKVLVQDDLLATGGTIEACCQMLEKNDAQVVGCAFLVQLLALGGQERLANYNLHALIEY